ncbi:hypothetical protein BH10ACT7_BH10ACT7_16090 [soil metagenome]
MAKPKRTLPAPLIGRFASGLYIALGLLVLYTSVVRFAEGRHLVGRAGSRDARDAWEAYGPGAFAADSATYLLIAGAAAAFLVLVVVQFITKDAMRHIRVIGRIAMILITTTAIGTLALLIYYWVSGVPFRNYQPMNADTLLYTMVLLIPLVALLGVVLVFLRHRRRMAPNVRQATQPTDEH